VDGVKGPKSGRNKFFFEMKVLENKALLPAQLRKIAKQLEDYPFAGLEVRDLAGTVEKSGEEYTFTARASHQKYQLKPSDGVKGLVEGGKKTLTLAGWVTQKEDKDPVTLEVTEAKETAK
jgi:hypothetical protein